MIPFSDVNDVCTEIISVFDTLVPLQYNDQDRRADPWKAAERDTVGWVSKNHEESQNCTKQPQ